MSQKVFCSIPSPYPIGVYQKTIADLLQTPILSERLTFLREMDSIWDTDIGKEDARHVRFAAPPHADPHQ